MQVRLLPGSPSEGLPSGAVSRLENGWALALGVRLPLLPPQWRHGRVERQRAATARAAWPLRRFESCCLRLSFRCGRAVRRATVNREAQVRSLPSELVARPRGRTGYDAGLSIRKLRVRVPPGVSGSTSIQRWEADAGKPASACRSTAACRGVGHPAGFGRRRSLVRLQPGRFAP
jgi:hypothetical protein